MGNPYDQTAADLFSGVLASGAQASVASVASRNPDEEVRVQRDAAALGVPPDSARANPKIVQQRIAGQSVDWQNMARTAPRTTRFLNDTSKAAIAHDDIGVLGTIERLLTANPLTAPMAIGNAIGNRLVSDVRQDVRAQGGPGNYFRQLMKDRSPRNTLGELGAGVAQMDEGISGAIEAVARTVGNVSRDDIAPAMDASLFTRMLGLGYLARATAAAADYATNTAANDRAAAIKLQQVWRPDYRTQLGSDIGMGVESLPLSGVAAILTALSGGTAPALGLMGVVTGGQGYGEAYDQGLTHGQAFSKGAVDAVVEMATEYLPEKFLLKDLGGPSFKKLILDQAKSEIPGEQVATLLQDFNQWAMVDTNKGKSFDQYLSEIIPHARSTLIGTGVGLSVGAAAGRLVSSQTADQATGVATALSEKHEKLTGQAAADRRAQQDFLARRDAARKLLEDFAKLDQAREILDGFAKLDPARQQTAARIVAKHEQRVAQAEAARESLEELSALARTSKLRERSTFDFSDLVDKVAEETRFEAVYVSAAAMETAIKGTSRCRC